MMISRGKYNKQLGDEYEREVVELLSQKGYWVHFIEKNKAGAQPFDVIAVKNKVAFAIDCKTLDEKEKYFYISRLEDNQIFSFEKWLACGNTMPLVFIKHKGKNLVVEYQTLKEKGRVNVDELVDWKRYSDS